LYFYLVGGHPLTWSESRSLFGWITPGRLSLGIQICGGWWEFKDDQLPNKNTILIYANMVEEQVMTALSIL
jgi:hypothetical protein